MKKRLIAMLMAGICFIGCGSASTANNAPDNPEQGIDILYDSEIIQTETPGKWEDGTAIKTVLANGPYGQISIDVPEGWEYTTCDWDQKSLSEGLYGITLKPSGAEKGAICVAYWDSFGVCGTGLESEKIKVAGMDAEKGTYDGNKVWSFISLASMCKGIVFTNSDADDWDDSYWTEFDKIMNTLSFNPDMCSGCAYVYSQDSECSDIGLSMSLKDITPAGATVVFNQYDGEHSGDFGKAFKLEEKDGDQWKELTPVTDNYGFEDIAMIIQNGETVEEDTPWDWIYGELEPGDYRLVKEVYFGDKYTLCAEFIVR